MAIVCHGGLSAVVFRHMVAGVDFMGEEFEEQVAFAKLLSCGPAPLFCPKGQRNKKGKTTNRKPKKCCELVMKHIQYKNQENYNNW